ncbi:MAG TPA: class C beta-lactamase [Azospirillum sp.]|nr:class C beta-lactamase [Azospirillum sp.]
MNFKISIFLVAMLVSACTAVDGSATDDRRSTIKGVVDEAIRPVMLQHGVPGMAVAVVTKGGNYVFNYGVASKETGKPVTDDTLFEIGSVSKTFTATLASYAQVNGRLSLSDTASKHLVALKGSAFDTVSLLNLGTHTPGGLPLQVPDEVTNNAQLMKYFQNWKPAYAPGTYRTYANPSIGMLGMIAAKSMNGDFDALMQDKLFRELGLSHTHFVIPETEKKNYAQGYTKKDEPIRMTPGVLWVEAYGLKSTAEDMARFIAANMGMLDLDETLQRAIVDTHTGYFRVGAMTQDLIWEQYSYPVDLQDLLAGNSAKISYEANPATRINPPLPPQKKVLMNKTGSTNGFAAYVAFIPEKELGIVLLANRNYPIDARVTAAHQILARLDARTVSTN